MSGFVRGIPAELGALVADGAGSATTSDFALCELLPDGVLVADEHGTVVNANHLAASMLGGRPLVGRPLSDVMALQDTEGNSWMDSTCPYTGLAIRRQVNEGAWLLDDGTELLVTAKLVRDRRGGPVRAVGVSLRSARARERLDRERSDLVATVAHELRSPLTGVRGFTATLLARWDRFNDDQKKMIMESVHTDTDRLTRLIAELLEIARIDTNRLSLHLQAFDPRAALDRVVASAQAGTGREIEVVGDERPPLIMADPDRFAQVLTNVVDNALRHGEGQVTIEVLPVPSGAEALTLAVEDEGAGIDPEIRKRVFTKFWKSGARGGSGLGMYLVHGLITAQGGAVAIKDASSGGARIELTWPVATVAESVR
ncbi:sensor histidine kinase [Nocardioides marmoribigeumensis]|uniref:histidine kinase n=1 Tax=Nocardioides marmoribigeumensis TaxID=433649 RepID=A0ABU2BQP4_9ACTN|nr:PAS domain-containing sensor histidine kinase [Nocardioides marmoribigeumensis]MDR7360962.1 signal transduction histidine kinase [Nocardioides marmoribigeumensis]